MRKLTFHGSSNRDRGVRVMRGLVLGKIILPILAAAVSSSLVAQQVPDRLAIRRQLEVSLPLPPEPAVPVAPRRPGAMGAAFVGALIGGGAFVGSAAACGKAQFVGPSPYGASLDGRQVAPGEVVDVPASAACTAGIGAGAALVSGWLLHRGRVGGYTRAVAKYQQDQAMYATTRANWERQVALRSAALDSAVVVAVADAEAALEATRTREAAERADAALAAEMARAGAQTAREIPITVPTTELRNPNAVAVVIGNQTYKGEVPPVDFAARDAALMRRFLVQTFGFREENIIFERDASFTTLTRIFGSATDPKGQLHGFVEPDGSSDVFIFYSGHGAPDPGSGSAYLVSSDADPQTIRLTGYSMRQLQANLAQLPARSITMVLDACFSGLADRGALLRGVSPLSVRVENPVLTHPNAVVFTASQANEVSGWYDAQKQGLFTYVFLDAVSAAFRDGSIPTAKELAGKIAPEVQRLSRRLRQREQSPQLFGTAVDSPLPFVQRP